MTLSWKNPIVKAFGWIKVRSGRSCIWCNEYFHVDRRLDESGPPFCSGTCRTRFKIARRVALGLRKAPLPGSDGARGLPGIQELGKHVDREGAIGDVTRNVQPRKPKAKKLVNPGAAGYYSDDELAKRYNIPRLSFETRMPVGYDCHYCGKARGGITRDHIVASSIGGSNMWFNLVPACVDCQTKKADGVGDCTCLYCLRARKLHEEAKKANNLLKG